MTELTLPLFEKGWTLRKIFKCIVFTHLAFYWDFSVLVSGPGVSEPAGGALPSGSKEGTALRGNGESRGEGQGWFWEQWKLQTGCGHCRGRDCPYSGKRSITGRWPQEPRPPRRQGRRPLLPLQPHSHPGVPIMDRSNKEQWQSVSRSITRLPPRWPHPVYRFFP